jgi:hypothetical protein
LSLKLVDHASGPLLAKERFIMASQPTAGRFNMRSFSILAVAVAAFAATMTVETTSANAVVCAAGVDRAGCAGPKGAAVVVKPHRPLPAAMSS